MLDCGPFDREFYDTIVWLILDYLICNSDVLDMRIEMFNQLSSDVVRLI